MGPFGHFNGRAVGITRTSFLVPEYQLILLVSAIYLASITFESTVVCKLRTASEESGNGPSSAGTFLLPFQGTSKEPSRRQHVRRTASRRAATPPATVPASPPTGTHGAARAARLAASSPVVDGVTTRGKYDA